MAISMIIGLHWRIVILFFALYKYSYLLTYLQHYWITTRPINSYHSL